MRIVFWGNGNRGAACLRALCRRGQDIALVVVHPPPPGSERGPVAGIAREFELPILAPQDPNDHPTASALHDAKPDLSILAGYGRILQRNTIDIPRLMTINLHAGALPQYRGSSPLNWALIHGAPSFTLSIIRVVEGIDAGDVLAERTLPIGPDDTIADLHAHANHHFPQMLLDVLERTPSGRLPPPRAQNEARARYFPLRFPDDGLVLWDQLTAAQVHNRIRALTEPYPCAYTYWHNRRIDLLASALSLNFYGGEPGRVYRKTSRGLLVCAADCCLWITRARFAEGGSSSLEIIERYDRLATVGGTIEALLCGRIAR